MNQDFKIIPNPDKEFYDIVVAAVKENDGYCCCGVEHTPDMKCMCKDFRERTVEGPCNCGRYIKVKKDGISGK